MAPRLLDEVELGEVRAAGIAWRLVLCIALIAIASPRIEAQAQPVPVPSVAVSPASAAPGETVILRGAGWSPGARLSARTYEAASVGGAGGVARRGLQRRPERHVLDDRHGADDALRR